MSTLARVERAPKILGNDWPAHRVEGPMVPGSVLVHAPSSAFQAPGGGENQLVQTARQLERRGLVVRPFNPWLDRVEDSRLLHLFGMSREGLELARVARARRVPVVLSPICWFEPAALRALASSPLRGWLDVSKLAARRFLPGLPDWRRELLAISDAILPNSKAEADQVTRLFGVDRSRIQIVPNGVDARFAQSSPRAFHEWAGVDDFVLYVGRIEPRKNVLGLARCLRAMGRRLVVIGEAPHWARDYEQTCRREAGELATWLPRIGHDDPRLASAYAAARVVALVSWFETPGLAALEGAMAGRPVVVTPYGSAPEYFGGLVRYARPDRPSEIAGAIDEAWDAGPQPGLARQIGGRFSWSVVARLTAEAYDQVGA
ncbi:glycosyltransferase family 4 protein [Isosphaeraceae bacterium EP7]